MLIIDKYIKIRQGNITMYLFKLPVEQLINSYEISYYDARKKSGYQRPPQQAHFRKIAQFLVENSPDNILPMSIIAAANTGSVSAKNEILTLTDKIRIVDGQHRIKGIEYLKVSKKSIYNETYKELVNSYEFPIILLEVSERDSIEEIDTFININSKGKRVSINLAKELRLMKMLDRLKDNPVLIDNESKEGIATEITQKLAKDEKTRWYSKITLADEAGNTKPISIGTFSKSLDKLVNVFMVLYFEGKVYLSYDDYNLVSDKITELIKEIWDIIQLKWPECFSGNTYNICKGIGVSALHRLLASCLEEEMRMGESNPDRIIENAKDKFNDYLNESTVSSSYWKIGGRFTGLSSEQGYDTIVKIIKNQEDIDSLVDETDEFFF